MAQIRHELIVVSSLLVISLLSLHSGSAQYDEHHHHHDGGFGHHHHGLMDPHEHDGMHDSLMGSEEHYNVRARHQGLLDDGEESNRERANEEVRNLREEAANACPGLNYKAALVHKDDGYNVVFEAVSEDRPVGYVDIHWSLTRFGESRSNSTEFTFRMHKINKRRFEHRLRYSELDPEIKFGEGDILRYYFTYWVLPPGHPQGFDCDSEVHWFASPADTRPTRPAPRSPPGNVPAGRAPGSGEVSSVTIGNGPAGTTMPAFNTASTMNTQPTAGVAATPAAAAAAAASNPTPGAATTASSSSAVPTRAGSVGGNMISIAPASGPVPIVPASALNPAGTAAGTARAPTATAATAATTRPAGAATAPPAAATMTQPSLRTTNSPMMARVTSQPAMRP